MEPSCPEDFKSGDQVKLVGLPTYVKTAEPMPMLRPAEVLTMGEIGIILARHPGNYWAVRLGRGAFLLESQYLTKVTSTNSES